MASLRSVVLAAACLVMSIDACGERAPLEGKGCPCVESQGYSCCAASNRCVRAGEACERTGAATADAAAVDAPAAGGNDHSGTGGFGDGTGGGLAPGWDDTGGTAFITGEDGSAPADIDSGDDSGSGDDGVSAGDAGLVLPLPPPACAKGRTVREVERNFIVPTCGRPKTEGQADKDVPGCHNGNFAPRLDMAGMIAERLLANDQTGRLSCKNDFYVDLADWSRSNMIYKSDPRLPGSPNIHDAAHCLDGKPAKARMPFLEDPLSNADFECLRWYIYKLATDPASAL
jgi:hypothetical protein